MTPEQKTALKAFILADPAMGPLATGPNVDAGAIADLLNLPASPDYWIYKPSLSRHDLLVGTGPGGTTFVWGGSTGGYINRSQGERDAFREMFNSTGTVNPAQANIQAAFADIFSGAGQGAVGNRNHIAAISRKLANRVEKLFATGAGSTAAPSVAGYHGSVDVYLISEVIS